MECERNYQERLLTANNEYNERIRELYNEISNVRKEYEERLESLKKQKPKTQKKKKVIPKIINKQLLRKTTILGRNVVFFFYLIDPILYSVQIYSLLIKRMCFIFLTLLLSV